MKVHAGQTSLIPLTSSLYVEAELDSSDSVLVELGTGYYAEVGGMLDAWLAATCS